MGYHQDYRNAKPSVFDRLGGRPNYRKRNFNYYYKSNGRFTNTRVLNNSDEWDQPEIMPYDEAPSHFVYDDPPATHLRSGYRHVTVMGPEDYPQPQPIYDNETEDMYNDPLEPSQRHYNPEQILITRGPMGDRQVTRVATASDLSVPPAVAPRHYQAAPIDQEWQDDYHDRIPAESSYSVHSEEHRQIILDPPHYRPNVQSPEIMEHQPPPPTRRGFIEPPVGYTPHIINMEHEEDIRGRGQYIPGYRDELRSERSLRDAYPRDHINQRRFSMERQSDEGVYAQEHPGMVISPRITSRKRPIGPTEEMPGHKYRHIPGNSSHHHQYRHHRSSITRLPNEMDVRRSERDSRYRRHSDQTSDSHYAVETQQHVPQRNSVPSTKGDSKSTKVIPQTTNPGDGQERKKVEGPRTIQEGQQNQASAEPTPSAPKENGPFMDGNELESVISLNAEEENDIMMPDWGADSDDEANHVTQNTASSSVKLPATSPTTKASKKEAVAQPPSTAASEQRSERVSEKSSEEKQEPKTKHPHEARSSESHHPSYGPSSQEREPAHSDTSRMDDTYEKPPARYDDREERTRHGLESKERYYAKHYHAEHDHKEWERRERDYRKYDRRGREQIGWEHREQERREQERREFERKERERREFEHKERERRELERKERDRRELERKEQEHQERERRDLERRDLERKEQERRELEHKERERRELERREQERRELEHKEQERREFERNEQEHKERERNEQEQRELERREHERKERERRAFERRERERRDQERRELERRELERRELERRELERRELERRELDRREQDRTEIETREREQRERVREEPRSHQSEAYESDEIQRPLHFQHQEQSYHARDGYNEDHYQGNGQIYYDHNEQLRTPLESQAEYTSTNVHEDEDYGELPEHWHVHMTDNREIYYYNRITRESTWERPRKQTTPINGDTGNGPRDQAVLPRGSSMESSRSGATSERRVLNEPEPHMPDYNHDTQGTSFHESTRNSKFNKRNSVADERQLPPKKSAMNRQEPIRDQPGPLYAAPVCSESARPGYSFNAVRSRVPMDDHHGGHYYSRYDPSYTSRYQRRSRSRNRWSAYPAGRAAEAPPQRSDSHRRYRDYERRDYDRRSSGSSESARRRS